MILTWKTMAALGVVGAAIAVPLVRRRNRNNNTRSLISTGEGGGLDSGNFDTHNSRMPRAGRGMRSGR